MDYQPVKRYGHSTVKVGDYLYMWGGGGSGVDYDVMEVYHLPTGAWDQKPTTGTPPPGTRGYSIMAIGKDIYYFGGRGVRDYQNSLHCFNVDSLKWRELSPSSSDHGPMKKAYCGMVSVHFDSEHYLVIIGGLGSSSTPKQPNAQYNNYYDDLRCNEIHYYRISSDQWISPVVTGDRPPPIEDFTLTPVANNTAVIFGGYTDNGVSNKLYMISFTKTLMDILEVPNPGGSVQWPEGRYGHSSTNLPDNVTRRFRHSLSMWSVTPTTNWIIEFGGGTSYSDTAVIELISRSTKKKDTE
ncbi:PREDICTED: kelch domain-containing protein 4-like [Amphimedon queenslandica]|uniref:Uncharacterized protein n=1 Tax=Amphimedon queenslandica TaxID=400682 RepID=A0AAN0JFD8_AMPQE|nr:PREDICTED: kelch domain-containing protein 4-like [Amphimedon queenslandica]|eukprot:XP_019855755.1 PREDICTED: kelch domain-containing protein 4-like [Amphimedon queenslandica]